MLQQLHADRRHVRDAAASRAAPSGTVTGQVTPVDINLTPPRRTRAGATARSRGRGRGAAHVRPGGVNDFAGFVAGNIALIQRGDCTLRAQGRERAGRRRGGSHHLQPGQHARRASGLIVGTARQARPSRRSASRSSARASPTARRSPRPARPRPVAVVEPESRTDVNVIAELHGQERQQRRHGRRAPRLGRGRARDQRQRQRLRRAARDVAEQLAKLKPREHAALRVVGRRGGGPDRLDGLRRRADARPSATGSRCT